jgi:AGZA family xanthine/uracil permease-like MFS transporter
MNAFLDRRFSIAARGSTLRVALLGGLSTFRTISYILFVNPAILSAARRTARLLTFPRST